MVYCSQRKLGEWRMAVNKEDILSLSRKENKSGDEREEKIRLRSRAVSAAAGALLCMVFVFVEEVVFERNATPIWGIYVGIQFVEYLINAIKLKKRLYVVLSGLWGTCFLVNIVNYVLENIG